MDIEGGSREENQDESGRQETFRSADEIGRIAGELEAERRASDRRALDERYPGTGERYEGLESERTGRLSPAEERMLRERPEE